MLGVLIFGLWPVISMLLPTAVDLGGTEIAERIGLSPQVLASSNVNATDATTLLDRLELPSDQRTDLIAHQGIMDQAIEDIAALQDRLVDAPGDHDVLAAMATAEQALSASRAAYLTARLQLLDSSLIQLTELTTAGVLARSEAAVAGLPAEFGAVLTDHAERHAARLALRAEQRAQRRGETVPDAARSLLESIRQDAGVAQASVWRSLHEDGVRAIWNRQ